MNKVNALHHQEQQEAYDELETANEHLKAQNRDLLGALDECITSRGAVGVRDAGGYATRRFNAINETARAAIERAAPTERWCETCDGIGAIDAPWSGSDPSCPDCGGEGKVPV